MSEFNALPSAVPVPASEIVLPPVTETMPVIAAREATAAAKADEPVTYQTPTPAPAALSAAQAAPAAVTAHSATSHTAAPAPAAPAPAAVTAAQAAPAAAIADETKSFEPIREGILGYKAPGLLKQLIFSKKDFWFSDEPVAPARLDQYVKSEKSELSQPVVAWASQTGKGLLFFVKKGETDRTQPAGVIPLYMATDLEKSSSQEFSLRVKNQSHTFKAGSDVERDGWFSSVEKSMELGKANMDSIHESEAYKTEHENAAPVETTLSAGGATIPVHPDRPSLEFRRNSATEAPGDIETDAVEGVVGLNDKPKPIKRASSFFTNLISRSPTKEKTLEEAELRQDRAVSDAAPQLPATITESKLETEAAKDNELVTPGREKKSFLSGLLPKRERSVSPSATNGVASTETAAEPVAVSSPVVTNEETKLDDSAPASRRQSVLGGLSRRASKMMSRVQSHKKETPGESTNGATIPVVENGIAAHEPTEIKPVHVANGSTTGVSAAS